MTQVNDQPSPMTAAMTGPTPSEWNLHVQKVRLMALMTTRLQAQTIML